MVSATLNFSDLLDGELAEVKSTSLLSKKTKPPSPYTEGTILEDMKAAAKYVEDDPVLKKLLRDSSGLGTAATRDSVLEGLKHDKYLEKKGKYLVATEKGIAFIDWLDNAAPELTNVALTARWEAELSVVAEKGGGVIFENKVANTVAALVATLKAAPPIGGLTSTKRERTMSETETEPKRSSKPTDKQLDFAKSIAKKIGIEVPADVLEDFDACKAFIDANLTAANRPSEKQLSFASKIAASKKLTIPPEVLAVGKDLSKWIDENK